MKKFSHYDKIDFQMWYIEVKHRRRQIEDDHRPLADGQRRI